MATQNPTITQIGDGDGSLVSFAWTLTGTDDGAPMQFGQWADRTVQFVGTWGGGTVVWEGSNDGANYVTLSDPANAAISKTANGLAQVIECVAWARPRASVGVTTVTVTAVVRRANPLRT